LQEVLETCAGSSDCYISYDWNDRLKYAFIFHFFGLLWTNQFIVGLSSVVVAGAVANFYWSRGDSKRCGITSVHLLKRNYICSSENHTQEFMPAIYRPSVMMTLMYAARA
jgi:hypothetical protein